MFKPHYGTCTECDVPNLLIVVKKGWCERCNHAKKTERRGNIDVQKGEVPATGVTQDIEGYSNSFRAPIRKKKKAKPGRERAGKDQIREKVDFGKTTGLQGITKQHTLVYMKAFGYTIADFIPCEITGLRCNDVHHIYARGMGGDEREEELYNRIENLMGLTREKHNEHGDKKEDYEYLIQKHFEFLSANGVPYDKHFFDKW